ncbi:hypothetical protein, partial [Enterobacter hormaechei]
RVGHTQPEQFGVLQVPEFMGVQIQRAIFVSLTVAGEEREGLISAQRHSDILLTHRSHGKVL